MDPGQENGGGPMSIRGYARRRGVSAPAVLKAIETRRLVESVAFDENGTPSIVDAEVADHEWDANTDLSRAPGYVKTRAAERNGDAPPDATAAPGAMSLGVAAALEKEWKAKLAELDYMERTAALVDAGEIEAKLTEAITRCRTRLLGVPSKMKTAIPILTRAHLVIVDALIREALEELATMAPGAPDEKQGAA